MLLEENVTVITAPLDQVWNALVRFDDYSRWHPRIRLSGTPGPGTKHDYTLWTRLSKRPTTSSIKIVRFEPRSTLAWRFGLGGLLSIEEEYILRPDTPGARTQMTHRTVWKGLFSYIAPPKTRARMCAELKDADAALQRLLIASTSSTKSVARADRRTARPR